MIDNERRESLRAALLHAGLDAVVCSLPKHVLLLSGYWPVVGTSIAIGLADGSVILIVPEDEKELAERTGARLCFYKPGSLEKLVSPTEAILEPLAGLCPELGHARIAIEGGENSEPASYAAMHLYENALERALKEAFSGATIIRNGGLLKTLSSVKTVAEIERIRISCSLAERGFVRGAAFLGSGLPEITAAQVYRAEINTGLLEHGDVQRAEGFAWVMSGPNSALAHGAFARSRTRNIKRGDLVLVHCNAAADGYWTDITRTYCIGKPDDRALAMYAAVFEARFAALNAIQPGRAASEVDSAARTVIEQHGFGKEFKHSTGHGVGFGAISPDALPRIHPKSPDILQPGMVFNVEPAIYIEGYGGIRHCDMVAVTDKAYELLTPFHSKPEELFLDV